MKIGNSLSGVLIDAAPSSASIGNLIGTALSGNLISGNTTTGITIQGATSTNNIVAGNKIGTDRNGTQPLGNTTAGIYIVDTSGNTIGGSATEARNIISGNAADGVVIYQPSNIPGTLIQGNFIGTDVSGTLSVGNAGAGIDILYGRNNTIGSTAPGAANVISGNTTAGIFLNSTQGPNTIQGNLIGTSSDGTQDLGNSADGIYLQFGVSTLIGGIIAGSGNLISGNDANGIRSYYGTQMTIQGNRIGTALNGVSPLGNTGHGMAIEGGAGDNTIGGSAPLASNFLAFNGGNGVSIAAGLNNALRGNSIFSNGALGINLVAPPDPTNGVTPNDLGDADAGANGLQNYPDLFGANITTIFGSFNSTPNTIFTLEFFASPDCDPSNNGEGKAFLGSKPVTTDGDGNVALFSATVPTTLFGGTWITATATDPNGNTSEFSQCVAGPSCDGPDSDCDGCDDAHESGPNKLLGGDRDKYNPWDFFDVPTPVLRPAATSGIRSKTITLGDAIAALYYVGTSDNGPPNANGVDYDSDLDSDQMKDGAEYDRSAGPDQQKPWRTGPPSGAVSIGDVILALGSIGANCS